MASQGGGLAARIAERARRFGSIPWSAFMEAALYDPVCGFYQTGGRAGRRGDFVTSPELGPLFATACAAAIDQCWEDLRHPDPFVVVEAAAGAGTLAVDILAAGPACAPALRYVLVERSAQLRAAQAARLAIELPAWVLGPRAAADPDEPDDEAPPARGIGPLVTALAELPAEPFTGVVLANELLDNLPVDLFEYRGGRWHEVRVAAAAGGRQLVELVVPAPTGLAAEADRLLGGRLAREGARIPLQRAAQEWLRQALETVEAGRVILFDYADTTAAMAERPWTEWLRTFRHHQPGREPLAEPGEQDITCVVALDQLGAIRPPAGDASQTDWLAAQGLDGLIETARVTWRDRAPIGDLQALRARSRVEEAEALTDAAGLGGHRVLQWIVGRQGS